MPGNGPLAKTLRWLHQQALVSRDRPFAFTLKSGLTVIVKVSARREHLQISRQNVDPSGTEWKTVIAHWPHSEIPPELQPRPVTKGTLHTLSADWPRPAPKPLPDWATKEGAEER